jgi:hypothetical protein
MREEQEWENPKLAKIITLSNPIEITNIKKLSDVF